MINRFLIALALFSIAAVTNAAEIESGTYKSVDGTNATFSEIQIKQVEQLKRIHARVNVYDLQARTYRGVIDNSLVMDGNSAHLDNGEITVRIKRKTTTLDCRYHYYLSIWADKDDKPGAIFMKGTGTELVRAASDHGCPDSLANSGAPYESYQKSDQAR